MLGDHNSPQPALAPTETVLETRAPNSEIPWLRSLPIIAGESGLARYLQEIKRFPMLEPQEEYMLAKRWREHGDREAAHKLVTSHLRLVAKIAMGYRGYGLPIGEVISEGNVGLMQAVKRFEPDKGFKLATYAMWWIRASIQEYILRSWSLVKMGTTASQKKLFFNLRKAKSRISALDEGDLRDDQVESISKRLGVGKQDVIDMNRRLGGDASLNAPLREGGEGEWQDWLVDDSADQETLLADREESDTRLGALRSALTVLNPRERRIFEARRLADEPITLEELSAEFGVSRERVRQIEVRAFEKVQAGGEGRRRQGASAEEPVARGIAGAVRRGWRAAAAASTQNLSRDGDKFEIGSAQTRIVLARTEQAAQCPPSDSARPFAVALRPCRWPRRRFGRFPPSPPTSPPRPRARRR